MNLNDFTVNFKHLNREKLLEDWVWLIGKDKLPIMVTALGDAFLQKIDSEKILVVFRILCHFFTISKKEM
ncbi:hypothetical protein MO867_22875, partial [Microbulbifer sp. OS29]